jgi:hypothetical protein
MPFQFRTPEVAPEIMPYGVLTLSTRTTFLDSVMNLEGSTEQVPYSPLSTLSPLSHFPHFPHFPTFPPFPPFARTQLLLLTAESDGPKCADGPITPSSSTYRFTAERIQTAPL